MPYQVTWYLDQRVIYSCATDIVTLEDIQGMNRDIVTHLSMGQPLVHLLVNLSEVKQFPTNLPAIKRTLPGMNNPDLGWTLIYGAGNPFLRFLASTLAQVIEPSLRLHMFSNLDQSLTFLQDRDSSLSDLHSLINTA